jgi:predicted RNA methylase
MKLRTIYDLGANHGEDTARYLHYADKVISVEANPIIAEGLSHKFAAEIAAGRVELLNIGI